MKPAIDIQNLGKQYKRTTKERYLSFRDVLTTGAKTLLSGAGKSKETFWALQDINLQIMPGERVGIIGRNGAGKSTLLKIISRITPPTVGEVILRGRVGSLLEVGTGFHPELTGRENIFLNGSILGLKRQEIKKQLDAIIDFSGVEKFIDSPLKHYSSGMQMRLAFAVAAHLESEILLIDEVLAVGDADFQKKCIGKMEEVSKQEGRTILFVSHDMQAISTLTQRTIYLSQGKIAFAGSTSTAIQHYLSDYSKKDLVYIQTAKPKQPCITSVFLETSMPNNVQENGKEMKINVKVEMPTAALKGIAIAVQVKDINNRNILHLSAVDGEVELCKKIGKNIVQFIISDLKLYKGQYLIDIHMSQRPSILKYETIKDICPFEVVMYNQEHSFKWEDHMCAYTENYNFQSI